MKKCLFVISNINIGGPQKSLLALFDKIDYSRYEVDLLPLHPDGTLKEYFNKNVRILDTPELVTAMNLPVEHTLKWLGIVLKKGKIGLFFRMLLAIFNSRVLKKSMVQERQRIWKKYSHILPKAEGEYDLAFGILGLSTYYVVDCVNAKKKFHWIRSDTRILNKDTGIEEEYFRKLSGFLSVSEECAKIFEDMYPFTRGNVRVLYNYIPLSFYERIECDTSAMEHEEGVTKIITVCRLDPLKGIELAIDACRILLDQGMRIKWYVLGGGGFRTRVEEMIRDKKMEDHFILLGFQLNTLRFIEKADIFVHPSRTEGKSNAVDEAKYAGKPVVVTNYPTVGEAVKDGYNGLICQMDGASIADTVKRLIEDEKLRKTLSDNCMGKEDAPEDLNSFIEELCQ